MDWSSFAILAAVTFAGSLVQSAFGFGFAILAAPLFLVVMDSTGAVPVLAVLNLAVSALVAARLWRQAPLRLLGLLCLGSAIGFPAGLWLFKLADVSQLKVAVGVLIMAFALLLFARERGKLVLLPAAGTDEAPPPPASLPVALAIGWLAGAMGAALAMPGPVAMLYLSAQRLDKQQSRALSLGLFSFIYAGVSLLHGLDGGLPVDRLRLAAELMIFVLAGALAGQALARSISEAHFRQWVLMILFLAGFYAVLSAS